MEEQKNIKDLSFGLKFINPREVIDALEITAGMLVGDFGSGTGYFTFPLADKVEQSGCVYALDILKEKLEAIESEAKVLRVSNIVTKRANLELSGGSKLEDDSLDWVFLVTMLFQNKNKKMVMDEAVRVLKKKGKILVVEWNTMDSSFGPNKELRVSKEEVCMIAQDSGLSILNDLPISDFHYGIILEK